MALAVISPGARAIAYMACSHHAPLVARLTGYRSNYFTRLHVEVPTPGTPLIVLRRGERRLGRVTWRRFPGAQEMPTLLPVIIRPYVLAPVSLEDNPCGLCCYCCCHLY